MATGAVAFKIWQSTNDAMDKIGRKIQAENIE
jgi:hypothetical protein